MNSITKSKAIIMTLVLATASFNAFSQSMSKKFKTVKAKIVIDAPASEVWEAMVKDYGAISNWSPYVYADNYEKGSLKGEKNAERKCNLNEKGSMWVHERIADINDGKMEMRNIVIALNKVPMDTDNTQAFYRVKDNGDGTSTASYEVQFRGKPAIMTGMMKGGFKKSLTGNLVGLKHYVEKGEAVTPMNKKYKEIKNDYKGLVTVN